jgi:hypothetical protein
VCPERHGVTPLADYSRRFTVRRGKRRAAGAAAHLNAARSLTSEPLGGLAEEIFAPSALSSFNTTQVRTFGVFATQRQRKHLLPQKRRLAPRVQAHCRSPGTALCMSIGCRRAQRCLTRRDVYWLRVVLCTSSAPKSRSLGESILLKGKMHIWWLGGQRFCHTHRSARATCSSRHPAPRTSQGLRHELPRRRPTHASTRQDAAEPPRAAQDSWRHDRLQCSSAYHLLLSRQAARRGCRGTPEGVLRVNRLTVGRTTAGVRRSHTSAGGVVRHDAGDS